MDRPVLIQTRSIEAIVLPGLLRFEDKLVWNTAFARLDMVVLDHGLAIHYGVPLQKLLALFQLGRCLLNLTLIELSAL